MTQIQNVREVLVTTQTNILPCVTNISRRRLQCGSEQTHQSRFARAIGPFDLHDLASTDGEVDLFEDIAIIALKLEAFDCEKWSIGQLVYPRLFSLGIMPKIRGKMLSLGQLVIGAEGAVFSSPNRHQSHNQSRTLAFVF